MVRGGQWFDPECLRAARMAAGLSQRELGRRSGVPAPSICLFEQGRSRPEPSTLFALARALRIAPATLLTPTEGPPSLARRRIEAGLLQREVAYDLGIPPSTYSAVERGEATLPSDVAAHLDRLLDERAAQLRRETR